MNNQQFKLSVLTFAISTALAGATYATTQETLDEINVTAEQQVK